MFNPTFTRNLKSVLVGNGMAQIILLVSMPLLTRLFSPDLFGMAAVFSTVMQLASSFSTWRFDWLIPNDGTRREAIATSLGAMAFLLMFTLLFSLALPLYWDRSADTELATVADVSWLLIPAILGLCLHNILHAWFIREGNLVPVSKTKVAQTLGYVSISIFMYYAGFETTALIYAITFSTWMGLSILIRHSMNDMLAAGPVAFHEVRAKMSSMFSLATTSTGVSVLNNLSSNFPVIVLSALYTLKETGVFAIVLRLVVTPLTAVTSAVTQSFWSNASELSRAGRYQKLLHDYRRMTCLLLALSVVIAAGCAVTAQFLDTILGSEWQNSGYVLMCLIPMIVGIVTFTPSNHLVVLEKQGYQLYADLMRLMLMFVGVSLSIYLEKGFLFAVAMLSVASFVGHSLLFVIHEICLRRLVSSSIN